MSDDVDPHLVLYRFYDEYDDLLYVGISIQAWQRFGDHRRGAVFYAAATKIILQRGFASIDELRTAERAAIYRERPRFNVIHNPSPRPRPVRPEPVYCSGLHHCRKPFNAENHDPAACRCRDEEDRAIVARVDHGESAEVVAASLGIRVEYVTGMVEQLHLELADGIHGCWEHAVGVTAVDHLGKRSHPGLTSSTA